MGETGRSIKAAQTNMLISLEIVGFVAAVSLGVLWIAYPGNNWEPWILLCASLGALAELCRRIMPKVANEPHSFSTTSQSQRGEPDYLFIWLKENVHTARLSESLPRSLQFSKQTGNAKLERWVRLELYGYTADGGMTESDIVPEYRKVTGRWMDDFNNKLDLSHYPDLSIANEYRFRFGVAKLEELASRQEMQNIADDHAIHLLREHLNVHVTRFCFSPIEVRGVLDTIRNKLAEKVLDGIREETAGRVSGKE